MEAPAIEQRPFPYPYRAMLAICSDLDETPDRHVYREIMTFLNTTETTSMGCGIGLEVGNTIYFDMPPDQFAYWNTDEAGQEMVRALIRSGHVDCLHSYGDLATTRSHAGRALDELARHDCKLEVWIDHAVAPSNFGADIMQGLGDVFGSDIYHADLTCDYGIKYVWRGRVTSVTGQGRPRHLGGILTREHMARSAAALGKEWAKGVAGRFGNAKYAMHGPNQVTQRIRLRDGHPAHEFIRSNPYWGGVGQAATADGFAEVVTRNTLDRLVARGGSCILYTHLGKISNRERPFGPSTCRAMRMLAEYHREGKILVTTTRRLLGYSRAARAVASTTNQSNDGKFQIDLQTRSTPNAEDALSLGDYDGLTFYLPDARPLRAVIDGKEGPQMCHNAADHTGRCSVSIPWSSLEFPDIYRPRKTAVVCRA